MRSLLMLLAVGFFAQDAPVRDLIQNLEDDRADAREKAQKDLVALGDAAVPALREILESTRSSGELKLRAAAVLKEIDLSAKAAKVYREFKRLSITATDRTLREVLDEVARRAEVKIDPATVDGAAKVSIDAKDDTLFEVLDQLCRDQAERTWEALEDGSIRMSRDRHVNALAVYGGPFRVRIQSMNTQRNNDFKARTVVMTVSIQADWDKRLKPSKIVEIDLTRAVDDQGTALDIKTFDGNMVFRGGPGVQLRVGVGMAMDALDNTRSFMFSNVNPAAAAIELEGTARYTFPLDQREIKFEKPGATETRDVGDTTIRLNRTGNPENWTLSFHRAPSAAATGWGRTIAQRFDPDSFVVVDQDGTEFPGVLRSQNRGRQVSEEMGVWFQGFVQRTPGKTIKEVRFRFVDQTLVKSVPFKFTAVPLP
ncbi:MAG: hypothetical protein EHM91_04565 [Planctomycetota bacterium]|nr:MAG: hypothetical protein EHM91_04565 [Planctomycetota bacterium]